MQQLNKNRLTPPFEFNCTWNYYFLSPECVVVDAPVADKEEDEENTIEIKVQGNDPDSRKTFKATKVIIEINNSYNVVLSTSLWILWLG